MSRKILDATTLEQETGHVKDMEQALRDAQKEKSNAANKLRGRVRCGEVEGDPLQLFIISRYGAPDEELENVYRQIESDVAGHVGEFVLMVHRREECSAHGGPGYRPPEWAYAVNETLYLGVITKSALELDIANGACVISTNRVMRCHNVLDETAEQTDLKIETGLMYDFGKHLNKPVYTPNAMVWPSGRSQAQLELHIGDDVVRAWFDSNVTFAQKQEVHYQVLFSNMARALGRPVDLPMVTEEMQRRKERVFTRLQEHIRKGHCGTRQYAQDIIGLLGRAVEYGLLNESLITVRQLCEEYKVEISDG